MKKDKYWLERKINSLNKWLMEHNEAHFEYKQNLHNRNYYVNKLIELEENNLKTVKV